MTLTERQKACLDAMGIDVWLPKAALAVENVEQETASAVVDDVAPGKPVAIAEVQPQAEHVTSNADVSALGWEALQTRVAECRLCELHKTRTQTVFGVGNRDADWLIIGEAPGADEDRQGEPFVGRAGQLLNAMLQALGLAREDVYIANILKCRPPQNRDPKAEEVAHCMPWLQRQIQLIQPKVILALGRIAAQNLLQTNTSLGRLRGRLHYIDMTPTPVIVTYHPAYLLRSPLEKRKSWEDLLLAKKTLESAAS
ncbi:MAG TPA: uracil-DNA glycosylase [Gammaproteobacteria bacterium]|nr:uracil-DNA glycosylase [Gammaproteobacteria bacterium]